MVCLTICAIHNRFLPLVMAQHRGIRRGCGCRRVCAGWIALRPEMALEVLESLPVSYQVLISLSVSAGGGLALVMALVSERELVLVTCEALLEEGWLLLHRELLREGVAAELLEILAGAVVQLRWLGSATVGLLAGRDVLQGGVLEVFRRLRGTWFLLLRDDSLHVAELLLQGGEHLLGDLELNCPGMVLDGQGIRAQVLYQSLVLPIVVALAHLEDHVLVGSDLLPVCDRSW